MRGYTILILIIISTIVITIYFWNRTNDNSRVDKIVDQLRDRINLLPEDYNSSDRLSDIFDDCYLIALPERKDNALKALSSFDVYPKNIDAVWKGDLDYDGLIDENIIEPTKYTEKLGTVGCYLSHIKTLQTFLNSMAQTAVIFEDDIEKCTNKLRYQRRLTSLISELGNIPDNLDILFLGFCHIDCKNLKFVSNQIVKNGHPHCTHAYVVTRNSARIILENAFPMSIPIDHLYKKLSFNKTLNTCTVFPGLFEQNRQEESIIEGKKLDKTAICWHRKFDNKFRPLIKTTLPTEDPLKFSIPLYTDLHNNVKYIHQSWKDSIIPDKFTDWAQSWKNQYPNSKHLLWTDKDNLNLVETEYPEFLEVYNSYDKHIKRCDAVRYLYLYIYGGLYVDLDFLSLKSLEPLLHMFDHPIVFGEQKEGWNQVPNDIMYSRYPGHPFWKFCLDKLLKNGATNKNVVEETGPSFLMYRITEWKEKYPKDILILKYTYLHPISATNEECRLNKNSEFNKNIQQCMKKYIKPETHAMTFWAGSWTNQWSKSWIF